MNFEYDKPIIHDRRTGRPDDPFVSKNETHIVNNDGIVILTEIPNRFDKVEIFGDNREWIEISKGVPNLNEYKVDYNSRHVTFNKEHIGKQLDFKYKGTGLSFINVDSVYTKSNNGKVTETLKSLVDTTDQAKQDAIDATQATEQATQDAITATENTNQAIDNANTLVDETKYIEPYNANTTYEKNNVVTFNGAAFMAKKTTKGNNPPNPTVSESNENWGLLSRKGNDGNGTVATHRQKFIATEGQRTFNLDYTYDQFQNRTEVTVGGVPQYGYEETTSTSITLSEGVPAGVEVVISYFGESAPIKSDIQTTVDNHTSTISNHTYRLNNNENELTNVNEQLAQTMQETSENKRALNYYWHPVVQPSARTDYSGWFADGFNWKAEQYIAELFEPLRNENQDYITRDSLGKDASGEYDVWRYKFTPKNYKKTILINTCLHGSEVTPMLVMARFLHYLVNEWEKYPALAYIRENVRIVYIPFPNPWGSSQVPRRRYNSNGVDLNRNFDYRWNNYISDEAFGHDYKGEAPMSEVEVQYIIKNLEEHPEAIAYLDLHNTGEPNNDYYIVLPDDNKYKTYDKLLSYFTRDIENPDINIEQLGKPNFANYIYTKYQELPASHPEWNDARFGGSKYSGEDLTHALHWFANVIIQHCLDFGHKERVRVNKTINISNIVENGNFSNGHTGWEVHGSKSATSIENTLVVKLAGTNNTPSIVGGFPSTQSFTKNSKLFVQAKVKCPDGCAQVMLKLRDFDGIDEVITSINNPKIGEFLSLSGIYQFNETSSSPNVQIMFNFPSASQSVDKEIEIKEVLGVDIVEDFENYNPSVDDMQFILSQTNWFSDTEEATLMENSFFVEQYEKDFMVMYLRKLKEISN